jgi:acyl carrier protein
MNEVRKIVRAYILREFLPGEDPALLTESVQLIRGGILDSIATLKLAAFLESQFNIELEAHEMSADYLNTIADIARLVESKQSK